MAKNSLNSVYIKLGSACNLRCKYCHAEQKEFKFNRDILLKLKELGVRNIVFGGGEPLLYYNTIKEIVEYFKDSVGYKIVTNGTLFTEEIVQFCNQYHFMVSISMDGIGSTRDLSKPIQWDLIKKLSCTGTAVTFYRETSNIRESLESLNEVKEKYLTAIPFIWSSFPNFVHSTDRTGILSDAALAKSYVEQLTELADEAFGNYVNLMERKSMPAFLKRIFLEFVQVKKTNGVACCNEGKVCILADGTICACPYTYKKVGDILRFDDIDWDKIKAEYTHEKCRECPIFNVCRNRCCMEVTENQCYIMKQMNRNILGLMEKYQISYDEFASHSKFRMRRV